MGAADDLEEEANSSQQEQSESSKVGRIVGLDLDPVAEEPGSRRAPKKWRSRVSTDARCRRAPAERSTLGGQLGGIKRKETRVLRRSGGVLLPGRLGQARTAVLHALSTALARLPGCGSASSVTCLPMRTGNRR